MRTFLEVGFDVTLALLAAGASRRLQVVPTRTLLLVTGFITAILALGATASLWLYPWTDALVVGFALGTGTAIGRLVPPRPLPLTLALLVTSAVDLWLTSQPSPGPAGPGNAAHPIAPPLLYGNVVLLLPHGDHLMLGALDLALCAALAVHAARRRLPLWVGLLPGPLAFVSASLWLLLSPSRGLPLVPFLTLSWMAVEVTHTLLRSRSTQDSGRRHSAG